MLTGLAVCDFVILLAAIVVFILGYVTAMVLSKW